MFGITGLRLYICSTKQNKNEKNNWIYVGGIFNIGDGNGTK